MESQHKEVKELETKIVKLKNKLASVNKKQKKSVSQDITMLETQLEFLHVTHKDQRDDLLGGGSEITEDIEDNRNIPEDLAVDPTTASAPGTENNCTTSSSKAVDNDTAGDQVQKVTGAMKCRGYVSAKTLLYVAAFWYI